MRMAKKSSRPICSSGIMAFIMDLRTTCKPRGKRTSILTYSQSEVSVCFCSIKLDYKTWQLVIWHKMNHVNCASSHFKYTKSAYKSNSYELYIHDFSDHVLNSEYNDIYSSPTNQPLNHSCGCFFKPIGHVTCKN